MTVTSKPPIVPTRVVSGMRLFTNSLHNVLSIGFQLTGRSLAGLVIPLLLAPENYGGYVYLAWLATILVQFSTLGLPHAAQRYIARSLDAGEQAAIARLLRRTGLATTAVPFTLLIIWQFGLSGAWAYGMPAFSLLMLAVILGVYSTIQIAVFKGYEDFAFPAIVEAITQAIKLVLLLALFLIRSRVTILLVFAIEVVYWLCQAVGLRLYRGRIEDAMPSGRVAAREILGYSATVGIIVLVDIVIWQRIEIGFLEGFGFIKEAGFFNLAGQISALITIVPGVAIMALFPSFAALQEDRPSLEVVYSMAASLLWILAVPLLAIGLFLAPIVLGAIYGESYSPMTTILPFVLVGRTFLLVGSTASTLIYATGRQRQLLKIVLVGAGMSLVCDLALIPPLGLIGAGVSVAVVQPFVTVLTLLLVNRTLMRAVPVQILTICTGFVALLLGLALARLGWPMAGTLVVVILYGFACTKDPATQTVFVWIRDRLGDIFASLCIR